jgi:hypothetical protein
MDGRRPARDFFLHKEGAHGGAEGVAVEAASVGLPEDFGSLWGASTDDAAQPAAVGVAQAHGEAVLEGGGEVEARVFLVRSERVGRGCGEFGDGGGDVDRAERRKKAPVIELNAPQGIAQVAAGAAAEEGQRQAMGWVVKCQSVWSGV